MNKDLSNMIIHDMRVPLTAVLASVETLAELMESKLDDRETRLMKIASSSGETLLNMINDLLDIGQLEEDELTLHKEPSSLSQSIEKAVDQIAVMAERKHLSITVDISPNLPEVLIDRDRILRVIENLLDNSRKFTPANGSIKISVTPDANNGFLITRITDTGPGVPKECWDTIFDKFAQLDRACAEKRRSPGLGLTYCKMMIEAHGGCIWVESEEGEGSTFTFKLPI